MLRKWVDRVIAVVVAFFIIINTRTYFIDQAIPYAVAQAEQRAIWEAKKEANIKRAEEEALKNLQDVVSVSDEDEKNTTSTSEPVSEEPESEPEFEPSEATGDEFYLNLGSSGSWESGEYLVETGEKAEHKRRLRYPDYIEITCPEYVITLSEGYSLFICEYDSEKYFIRNMKLSNADIYKASKDGAYFTITLRKNEAEKTLSPGQWGRIFADGIDIVICTEKMMEYSVSEIGSLIGGGRIDYDSSELVDLLFAGEDDKLAGALWNMQVANGVYTMSGEEIDNGRLTYYVSSSEGDDDNTGLDREHPKKTLDAFSGLSGINVLLKCGDEFRVSKGMLIKSDCIYGAYGEGERPVLNYYRTLDVTFEKDNRAENMWVADLTSTNLVTETKNKNNCNIGQLILDGELNWKRIVWSSKEEFDFEGMSHKEDGCWAIAWKEDKLYINSDKDPNEITIEYAPPTTAISIDKADNVTIKGLEIKGAGKHGCNITDSSNINIECCYFHHIGGSVLQQAGVRYGNAIQVWDSGGDIWVSSNYTSWIFDTCFTNQGSDSDAVCENIIFEKNIGTHFFWGIETWGDGYSDNGFVNIVYRNNILFDNVDVTNPTTPMHAGENSKLIGISDSEYVSYRNGYRYHQMAGINVNNSGTGEIVRIEGNIVWNSNRFLVLASNTRNEERFSSLKNNLLYAEVESEKGCLLRFAQNDTKKYCKTAEYLDNSNEWSVHTRDDNYSNEREKEVLMNYINCIGFDE